MFFNIYSRLKITKFQGPGSYHHTLYTFVQDSVPVIIDEDLFAMGKTYFSLEISEGNRITRIFQLILGMVCFVVAVFWLIYNIRSSEPDLTLWVTIIFLTGFSYYQVMAGLGRAAKFIEIDNDAIRLKKNSLFPAEKFYAGNLAKIEIYTLSIRFFVKERKASMFRLGTAFTDRIGPVKDKILQFAESNNIPVEMKNEEV